MRSKIRISRAASAPSVPHGCPRGACVCNARLSAGESLRATTAAQRDSAREEGGWGMQARRGGAEPGESGAWPV